MLFSQVLVIALCAYKVSEGIVKIKLTLKYSYSYIASYVYSYTWPPSITSLIDNNYS